MAWLGAGWAHRRAITVSNNSGGTLTDHCVRLKLRAANFDFTAAESDGADLRVTDSDGTTLKEIWKQKPYDDTGEVADVWFKATLSTGSTTFYLYYGNTVVADDDDPSNLFTYWNKLEAAADLTDLDATEEGSATWTTGSDAGAPNGAAVRAAEANGPEYGQGKAVTLPAHYTVELWTDNESTDGAFPGPHMNRNAYNTYYRPAHQNTSANSGWNSQVRRMASGTPTSASFAEVGANVGNPAASQWVRGVHSYHPELSLSGASVIDLSARTATDNLQGAVYDSVTGKIFASSNDSVYIFQTDGTLDNESAHAVTTSWGDLCVKDGVLYGVLFNSTTTTAIYKWETLTDLTTKSLEATLTSDFSAEGANGLTFDGTNFLVGSTNTNADNVFIKVYNTSWVLQSTIYVPIEEAATVYGIQSLDYVDGMLYMANHNGMIFAGNWDSVAMDYEITGIIDSGLTNLQGFCWNSDASEFYMLDRTGEQIQRKTIAEHGTNKQITSHWRSTSESNNCHEYTIPSINSSQDEIGIGGFRTSSFAQLFYRPWTLTEPVPAIGSQEDKPPIGALSSSLLGVGI